MQAPATGFAPRKGALLFLAVCLSATLVAAAPVVDVTQMEVVVWSDTGSLLTDADVTARDASGEFVKLDVLPNGTYLLPAVGPKTELIIEHPTLGGFISDVPLTLDAAGVRLDVVFSGVDEAEIFSPNLITVTNPSSGNGAPANDDCSGAIALGLGTIATSTIGATDDSANAPLCGTSTTTGIWFEVTGTGNTMTISTCNQASYDTKLSVYCGDCDDLTCITGLDDTAGCASFSTEVSWCTQDGATYFVLLHGFAGATGNTNLTLSDSGVPCVATVDCLPAVPTGACCYDDGSCEVLSADDCAASGGTYQGDDTGCFIVGDADDYSSNPNVAIPDGLGTGIPGPAATDTISVGPSSIVGDVDIDLTVNHTWTGDLIVTVEHGGTTVTLIDRPGVPLSTFGCSLDNWNITLDDEAGDDIESQCSTNLTGSYTPNNPLSAFDGMDASGDWTISVTDNAGADTGTLVSWGVSISGAGAPTCEQPECHLVIGSGPGSDEFYASWHSFDTQISDIVDSYPVLMEDIPEFVLPAQQTTGRVTYPTPGALGQAGFGAVTAGTPEAPVGSPEWMGSGSFSVQVLMWNPQVFPFLPEQYTPGLHVYLMADGTVRTVPFGTSVGGLEVWHEIDVNDEGQKVIRFPFTVPGF